MLNGKRLPAGLDRLLAFLGICGILAFALMVLKRHWIGYSDFDQIYMAGLAWRHGIVPYVKTTPEFGVADGPTSQIFGVYFYTPLCGMLASPLSFLSFPLASFVWKTGVFGLFLWAVWRFMRHVLSGWPVSARLFLLGVTALSGSLRWNLMQWQPTALIVALLLLFACAVLDNRWKVAIALGIIISIKVTYLLPVVGLLLWRGQGKWLAALLGIVLLLNGFALLPTGPTATLKAYRQSLRHMQDIGKQNYPDALDFLTPFLLDAPTSPLAVYTPHNRKAGEWSGEQIHLPFILSAWKQAAPWATWLQWPFIALVVAGLIGLARRTMRTSLAEDTLFQSLLFCMFMSLSLLVVYHQRYDAVALIPLMPVSLALLERNRQDKSAWLLLGVTVFFAYLLSAGLLQRWYQHVVVPTGWLPLTPICGYLTLAAFLLVFWALWRYVGTLSEP